MLDGLDRKVTLKRQCTFSNSTRITQNNVLFSCFIKLQEYWETFQSTRETKKSSLEKIMGPMLEEVIMSNGQMYSFLQLLATLKKLA